MQRRLSTVLAGAACLALLGGCGVGQDGGADPEGEDAARTAGGGAEAAPEVEGVRGFYGEYGDYVTLVTALSDGEITVDELEYPEVAQRDHTDASGDPTPPVYELSPPVGGHHLTQWHTCDGKVYQAPLIEGHAVHSMEHGAVWLAYDPELVSPVHLGALAEKIEGRNYSLMSPYPGLGVPVSLQSWGHQYQTEDPTDEAIDAYLDTYILNEAFNPEPNATCSGGVGEPQE